MPKRRTAEEMAEYQRARRARVTPPVTPPVLVTPAVEEPVTPAGSVTPRQGVTGKSPTRVYLRAELDRLKARYTVFQRAMDWDGCTAVNAEREPLFTALWAIERELPVGERYWVPARIQNAGLSFAR